MTPTQVATLAPVRPLAIDRSHSEVAFQVRHLITKVRGRFLDFAGTITLDDADSRRSRVDVTVQAASIDTGEPDRDKHLRSADFFEVDKHPLLTFASTAVEPRGRDRFDLTGDLTIHGVTRPVTFSASFLGKAQDPWGNEKFAFEGELTLNRKDFGLHWNAALETGGFLVGDEVSVLVSVQAK